MRDGEIVGVRHRPVDSTNEVPAKAGSEQYYWTVDELFELIDAALRRGAAVRASYDAERGFPTEIYIDYDTNAIGDELDVGSRPSRRSRAESARSRRRASADRAWMRD